jgi:hypothetical protein
MTSNALSNGFRPTAPIATPDRLAKPSSYVTVKNNHPKTPHIVIDRYYVGKEIKPGETVKDIEMLDEDIRRLMLIPGHDLKLDPTGSGFKKEPDLMHAPAQNDATLTDDELRANRLLQKTTNSVVDIEDEEDDEDETPPRRSAKKAPARKSGRARL